jgi:hypothetical protein
MFEDIAHSPAHQFNPMRESSSSVWRRAATPELPWVPDRHGRHGALRQTCDCRMGLHSHHSLPELSMGKCAARVWGLPRAPACCRAHARRRPKPLFPSADEGTKQPDGSGIVGPVELIEARSRRVPISNPPLPLVHTFCDYPRLNLVARYPNKLACEPARRRRERLRSA